MIARASVEWHRLVENRDWLRTGSSNKNFIPRTAEIAFGKYGVIGASDTLLPQPLSNSREWIIIAIKSSIYTRKKRASEREREGQY